VLEDDVELQANSCVDRAPIGEPASHRRQNRRHVLVGHGARVGANPLPLRPVGLAGSTKVGAIAFLSGAVGSEDTSLSSRTFDQPLKVGHTTDPLETLTIQAAFRGRIGNG